MTPPACAGGGPASLRINAIVPGVFQFAAPTSLATTSPAGLTMIVTGMPGAFSVFIASPSVSNKTGRVVIRWLAKNGATAAAPSMSMEIGNTNILCRARPGAIAANDGISATHGPHQVAQRLTTNPCPA